MKSLKVMAAAVAVGVLAAGCSSSNGGEDGGCANAGDELFLKYLPTSAESMAKYGADSIAAGEAVDVRSIKAPDETPATEFTVRPVKFISGGTQASVTDYTLGTEECPVSGFPKIYDNKWNVFFLKQDKEGKTTVLGAVPVSKLDIESYSKTPPVFTDAMQNALDSIAHGSGPAR